MRKIVDIFVILSVALLNFGRAGALRCRAAPMTEVRIFASLEEATGRSPGPAVLVFFSLDCPVCWGELFEVRYLIEKNKVPVTLIGISPEPAEDLEPFLAKHAFLYPVVSDPGRELFRRFRVKLEPLVVVVDGRRVIFRDNTAEDMALRRERRKQCLLEISVKPPS